MNWNGVKRHIDISFGFYQFFHDEFFFLQIGFIDDSAGLLLGAKIKICQVLFAVSVLWKVFSDHQLTKGVGNLCDVQVFPV